MVYDRIQAEAILARAQELDAHTTGASLDAGALQRVADELGLSREALSQAIDEAAGERTGPLTVEARATTRQSVDEVTGALASYLRLRGLSSSGWSVWEQASGWWPDLYRYRAHTHVAVFVAERVDGTHVRLSARLDRVWRVHLFVALLAPLFLVISAVGGAGLSNLVDLLLLAVLWVGSAIATFYYRREAIQKRLTAALVDVSLPTYRMMPW